MEARSAWICTSSLAETMQVGSGGLTTALSKYAIERLGAVVWGSAFSENFREAPYMKVERSEDLGKISGNKYFDVGQPPYEEILEGLKTRKALFVGTPCCTSGLRRRAAMSGLLDNLLTVTFICNSTVDRGKWSTFLDGYEKNAGSRLKNFNFKHLMGKGDFSSRFEFENGRVDVFSVRKYGYGKRFLGDNSFIQPKCTICTVKYPRINADFIVGDRWGFNENDYGLAGKRLSIAFCMTERAEEIMNDPALESTNIKLDLDFALNVCRKHNKMLFRHR